MKLVKANFPFIDKVTGKLHKVEDEPFEMSEERLAEVRAVNAHLVYVVGDVEPVEPSEPKASDEDAQPTEPGEPAEPTEPEKDVKPEGLKKPREKKAKAE